MRLWPKTYAVENCSLALLVSSEPITENRTLCGEKNFSDLFAVNEKFDTAVTRVASAGQLLAKTELQRMETTSEWSLMKIDECGYRKTTSTNYSGRKDLKRHHSIAICCFLSGMFRRNQIIGLRMHYWGCDQLGKFCNYAGMGGYSWYMRDKQNLADYWQGK